MSREHKQNNGFIARLHLDPDRVLQPEIMRYLHFGAHKTGCSIGLKSYIYLCLWTCTINIFQIVNCLSTSQLFYNCTLVEYFRYFGQILLNISKFDWYSVISLASEITPSQNCHKYSMLDAFHGISTGVFLPLPSNQLIATERQQDELEFLCHLAGWCHLILQVG